MIHISHNRCNRCICIVRQQYFFLHWSHRTPSIIVIFCNRWDEQKMFKLWKIILFCIVPFSFRNSTPQMLVVQYLRLPIHVFLLWLQCHLCFYWHFVQMFGSASTSLINLHLVFVFSAQSQKNLLKRLVSRIWDLTKIKYCPNIK